MLKRILPLFLITAFCPSYAMDNDKFNYIEIVPDEVIYQIAEHLAADNDTTLKDCNAFLRTCKRFNAAKDAIINQDNIVERYTAKLNKPSPGGYSWEEEKGFAPIHGAAALDAVQWVRKTIEKNALERDTRSIKYEETPLHMAAIYNAKRVAQLLIENGAPLEATNGWADPVTPLLVALSHYSADVTHLLIMNNANISRKGCVNKALHLAAYKNAIPLAQLLLKKNINVNDRDYWDHTPLQEAAEGVALEMTQFLLDNGADANAQDKSNETPLFNAAARDKTTLVAQLLISHHADIHAINNSGTTLLDHARNWKNQAMIDFLENLYGNEKE